MKKNFQISDQLLDKRAVDYLRGLVRMELRKKERNFQKLEIRRDQELDEFLDFKKHQKEMIDYRKDVLQILDDLATKKEDRR